MLKSSTKHPVGQAPENAETKLSEQRGKHSSGAHATYRSCSTGPLSATGETSITYSRTFVRSMCLRKSWPRPRFSWAPSIKPAATARAWSSQSRGSSSRQDASLPTGDVRHSDSEFILHTQRKEACRQAGWNTSHSLRQTHRRRAGVQHADTTILGTQPSTLKRKWPTVGWSVVNG